MAPASEGSSVPYSLYNLLCMVVKGCVNDNEGFNPGENSCYVTHTTYEIKGKAKRSHAGKCRLALKRK